MDKLLFVRQPQSYLPEIQAYKDYLSKHYPNIEVFESTDIGAYNESDYDIIWHFMGKDVRGKGNYVVHEYNSLSMQPLAALKDLVKKAINAKPDQRVFLNQFVQTKFGFSDGVPSYHRDMGIDERFFECPTQRDPGFDFILAGGLSRGPLIKTALEYFDQNMREASLLIVGDPPSDLRQSFEGSKNISFYGRVPYSDIPRLLSQARYGLNIMPDLYPFNRQTATKVQEYAAAQLKIVTTDYQWIQEFETSHGGNVFKLAPDFSNLSMEALEQHQFSMPDVRHLTWEQIIEDSGIFSFL